MPSVFTLGKDPFALSKVRSAKFFSAKGLCRVLFIGALGKIKKKICRVLGTALGKIFSAVNGYFAECPTQHSAKKKLKKFTLPSSPAQALSKVFFIFFKKKLLCRVPLPKHSAKFFLFFLNNFFAECPCLGTRQRISGFF